MSWEDDAPRFTTLRKAAPVARKAHACSSCSGTIQPGERYDLLVGLCSDEGFQLIRSHRRACYLDPSPADLAAFHAQESAQAAAEAEEEAWATTYREAEGTYNDDGVCW